MPHIEPSKTQIANVLALPGDGAIVMINLLRYRTDAAYPADSDATPCSGREAYQRYGDGVVPLLAAAGGRVIWMGAAEASVIGPSDETWDDAVLVEYPSATAFLEMTSSPAYQAIAGHRTAALADSRLIATRSLVSETATLSAG